MIGPEFSEPVLKRVTELPEDELAATLEALAAAELVLERTLYPEAHYAFKHPLTQEVAYRSQLRERRARTHRAAAGALEALRSDRHEELALLSYHWEQADEPLRAARWGARAAAWPGLSHAEQLHHWRRVRTLAGACPDSPEATSLVLGACVWILHVGARRGLSQDDVEQTFAEARELAATTGDKSAMAMVHSAYSFSLGTVGRLEAAIASAREAQELAEQAGDFELAVSVGLGLCLAFAGRNREALTELDRVLEAAGDNYQLGRRIIGASTVIFATFYRGVVLGELGQLSEARVVLEKALRLARENDDIECLGWAHSRLGALSYITGERGDGLEHTREALDIAERLGSSFSRARARAALAAAHLARGEHDEALALTAEVLQSMRETRTGLQYEAHLLSLLAEARLGLDDVEGARAAAAEGAATAATQGAVVQEAACRIILGRALLRQERGGDARAELGRAIELARDDGPVYIPHALLALRRLEEARRLFEQQGATGFARSLLSSAPPPRRSA